MDRSRPRRPSILDEAGGGLDWKKRPPHLVCVAWAKRSEPTGLPLKSDTQVILTPGSTSVSAGQRTIVAGSTVPPASNCAVVRLDRNVWKIVTSLPYSPRCAAMVGKQWNGCVRIGRRMVAQHALLSARQWSAGPRSERACGRGHRCLRSTPLTRGERGGREGAGATPADRRR